MARKADRTTLLEDARVSDLAVRLGLFIESRGPGKHRIGHDDFARVCYGTPSADTLRRAIRQLVLFGYVERESGGRGHPDAYSFRPAPDSYVTPVTPAPDSGLNTDRPAPDQDLSEKAALTRARLGPFTTFTLETEEAAEEGEPPIIPLSTSAERTFQQHGEKLTGCRGALRDYLRQRVPEQRQPAYVHKIAGWLNGLDPTLWQRSDGSVAEPDDRPRILADALNDLAASAESAMARPVGDPANLRTKISILINPTRANGSGRRPESGGGSVAPEGGGQASKYDRLVIRS